MTDTNNLIRCLGCMEEFSAEYDVCPHCGYEVGSSDGNFLHLDPGTNLIDRYLIGRTIGYGGFGVTYLAWDNKLQRKIAIKEYLPSEFATRMIHRQELLVDTVESKEKQYRKGLEKFLQEGRKLAQVNDIDGIVHMYDCFKANNTAYITMEYLEGQTLTEYLEAKGKLSEQETLDLMMPVLQALEAVHEKGIIHRDIAPDNLFVVKDDEGKEKLKLIDFGASKFASTTHSRSLTVIIKPGYSPEEQYRSNGEQGFYTDVYAIAAVIYQMVTGVRPADSFERRTSIESRKNDLLAEPGRYNKKLSANFETALLNALNVRIEDRTQTISDFEEELVSFEKVKRRGSSIKRMDFMRWPIWAKIGVPVAGLAAVAGLVFAILKSFSGLQSTFVIPAGYTRVPDFVMADFNPEAQEWAALARLSIMAERTEYSPIAASNVVLSQGMSPGTLISENTVIPLILSTGTVTYYMPDVEGLNLEDVRTAFDCIGIKIETKEDSLPGLVENGIIAQSVGANDTISTGDTIVLTVNRSSDPYSGAKPNIRMVGKTMSEALEISVENNSALCVVRRRLAGSGEADRVADQRIVKDAADRDIYELTIVAPDTYAEVPNLLYKPEYAAVLLLNIYGYDVVVKEETSEIVERGLVIAQSEAGSVVTLTISTGPEPMPMPSVITMTEEEAKSILSANRLVYTVEYGFNENFAEGLVYSQSIAAGGDVRRGDEITITVCTTAGLITIPDLSGLTLSEAEKLLKSQKIKYATTQNNESIEAKDTVLQQLPAAGTRQKADTQMTLVISSGKGLEKKLAEEQRQKEAEERVLKAQEEARIAKEQAAAEKAAAEKAAAEKAEAERLAAEQAEADRVEAERLAAEKAEADRIAAEKAEAARLAAEKAEKEKTAEAKATAEKAAKEKEEAEKAAAEKAAAEKAAAEKAAAAKKAAEQAAAEKAAAEKAAAEKAEAEKKAKAEAEAKAAAEREAAEKAYAEKVAAQRAALEKEAAEKAAAEAKAKAEAEAKAKAEAEAKAKAEAEAKAKAEAEAKAKAEAEAKAKAEAEAKAKAEAEAKAKAEEEAKAKAEAEAKAKAEAEAAARTWSEWLDALPGDVTADKYDIEEQILYSFRNLETTSSETSNMMSGWELYDTVIGNGDFGAWSVWSQTEAVGSDTREVETEIRYRYRDKQEESEEVLSDWGNWSNWTTTQYTVDDNTQVENKTQYSYRDKQTDTFTGFVPEGWTQSSSNTYWSEYGPWSDWQDDAVGSSDSRQIETRTVWPWYYYVCPSCGFHSHGWGTGACYTWSGGCGGNITEYSFRTMFAPIDYAGASDWFGTGKYYKIIDGERWFCLTDWGVETQYRYCDRSQIVDYTCWKWGDWSTWSDNAVSKSDSRDVRNQTVYRRRKRSTETVYSFTWTDWSGWSADAVTESDTREVDNTTFYRYRDRVTKTTYYFRRWTDWSDYSTTSVASGEDVDVRTIKQYRYRLK